ncbi:MAG TPA: hypothetical protein VMV72_01990 [Verrucomicrobiae bacterium]|nr:hypothetical protein [Verrucomicrobiae bacterium]
MAAILLALVLGGAIWIPIGHGGLPIIMLPFAVVYNMVTHAGERVATVGVPLGGDASGMVCPVSEKFGKPELQQLYDRLNSDAFRASLTNYNCGDAVPQLRFCVMLHRQVPAAARGVNISYSPHLSPAGRSRCLMFRLMDMINKVCSELDPAPPLPYDAQEMVCDCSKRDGTEEWVTWKAPSAPAPH